MNCFIVTLAPLESKASFTLMFCNAISLKLVVGTYMGGTTQAYSGKIIVGVPLGLSQITSLTQSMKSEQYVPSVRWDKSCSTLSKYWPAVYKYVIQIDVKYVLDSYCSLITIFILKKVIFSFTFMENIKNIYYSLKIINLLKIKRVILKHGVPTGIPWRNADLKCTTCIKITQTKTTYPHEFYWKVHIDNMNFSIELMRVSCFGLGYNKCFLYFPYWIHANNLSVKFIFISHLL